MSTIVQDWSHSLKIDLDNLVPTQESINIVCQKMCDFNYLVNAQSVTDSINNFTKDFYSEKLVLNHSDFNLSENSKIYIDSFTTQLLKVIKENNWSPELGEKYLPIMILTIGLSNINGKQSFDWRNAVSNIASTYIDNFGFDKLIENSKHSDVFIPQIITGAALYVHKSGVDLDLTDFNSKISVLSSTRQDKVPVEELLRLFVDSVQNPQMPLFNS